jgi:hypothetical protein
MRRVNKPAPKKKAPAKKPAPKKKAPAKKPAPRSDLGAPTGGFFAKQSPTLRPILEALRALVEAAAPEATSSLKWGMPFYEIGGATACALGAHKAHVNLILSGPGSAFPDPKGLLSGEGKTGRHLKLRRLEELPVAEVRAWLKSAAALARAK